MSIGMMGPRNLSPAIAAGASNSAASHIQVDTTIVLAEDDPSRHWQPDAAAITRWVDGKTRGAPTSSSSRHTPSADAHGQPQAGLADLAERLSADDAQRPRSKAENGERNSSARTKFTGKSVHWQQQQFQTKANSGLAAQGPEDVTNFDPPRTSCGDEETTMTGTPTRHNKSAKAATSTLPTKQEEGTEVFLLHTGRQDRSVPRTWPARVASLSTSTGQPYRSLKMSANN
ncbi:hypothetical protein B0T26DRAFT_764366 [Lasiosphaeria miniovina]|uniref:Uncharacterized protein n=1 Tax=Lasiosphaeria miniovina TaxID=1954250 RepID=A0AA40B3C1_9PEZI|nr:uncharacterized protein B0T26DRAFT_764366 [Lasiosphaeria miniovina]KAK0726941.1 hypothetical protein B0T26DRAFT_764366 [Lasiosphaeria miniovina]